MVEASSMGYTFRHVNGGDIEWLLKLRLSTMGGYIEASGQQLIIEEQRARLLEDFESIKIVTVHDSDIGMLKVVRNPEEWKLVQIQIFPRFQGSGLGTSIVNALVAEALGKHVPLTLSVLKVNPAKSFYDRLGFHIIEEKELSYKMGIDA